MRNVRWIELKIDPLDSWQLGEDINLRGGVFLLQHQGSEHRQVRYVSNDHFSSAFAISPPEKRTRTQ